MAKENQTETQDDVTVEVMPGADPVSEETPMTGISSVPFCETGPCLAMNMSDALQLTISITIIALGTSLPELFSSMIAIKNKHYNLLIGNIIGSNVINIVFVLGFSSLFTKSGIHIDTSAIMLKGSSITIGHILPYIIIAFILSHIMLIGYYLFKKSMSRIEGLLFVVLYVLFLYSLFQI